MATDADSKGAMDVKLHPMVIVNISDHFTREKVKAGKNQRVYGVLLGQQSGRKVEISNSYEILVHPETGQIDSEFLKKRLSQFQRVYSHDEILGWYATGKLENSDIFIHQQIEAAYNESPLLLILDPETKPGNQTLPIVLWETTIKVVEDKPKQVFTRVPYTIETTEAERIAVDHVANVSTGRSMLTSHLSTLQSAIKMLNLRVKIITRFVKESKDGTIPRDEGLLRSVNALCHLLPTIDTDKFKEDFLMEYNDALLVTYLATITKTTNAINEMIDKFNIAYDRHSRRRGFF